MHVCSTTHCIQCTVHTSFGYYNNLVYLFSMAEANCRRLLRDSYIFGASSSVWACCLVLQCTLWREWIICKTLLHDSYDGFLVGLSVTGTLISLNLAFLIQYRLQSLHVTVQITKKCVSHVYAMVLSSFLLISISYSRHCFDLPSASIRKDMTSLFRNVTFELHVHAFPYDPTFSQRPSAALLEVLPTVLFWDCLLLFIFCWILTTASVLIAQWELKMLTRRLLVERRNSVAPAG